MNIKGHEAWIREELIPNLIESKVFVLNGHDLCSKDVLLKSCKIKSLSTEDVCMLTNCYKAEIILTDADQSNEAIYRIVVKKSPMVDDYIYDNFYFKHLFGNEVNTYRNLIPLLGWNSKLPKYYYSHNNGRDAAIVLSDFNNDGWMMSKTKGNLSLEHIILAVQELGKFHGELYGLKLEKPKKFENIRNQFEESRFRNEKTTPEFDTILRIGSKRAVQSVRNQPEGLSQVPEPFLRKLEIVIEDPYNYQKKMVRPREPLAVICHGDYLQGNIAFKYDGNGAPIDVIMFDYQTMRYSSPMIDLSEFMASSTGTDVRSKYFDYIFSSYYNELNKTVISVVGTDKMPDYLTYENLLKEYALYMPYGLSIAGYFLQNILEPESIRFEKQNETNGFDSEKAYSKGGELVNRELRALIIEMYQMYEKLELELKTADDLYLLK